MVCRPTSWQCWNRFKHWWWWYSRAQQLVVERYVGYLGWNSKNTQVLKGTNWTFSRGSTKRIHLLAEVGQATESTYPAVVMTQIGFSSVHQLLFGQFWTIFWLIWAKQVKWLHRSNFLLKQEKNYLSANSNLNPIAPCDINGSSGAKP